MIPTRINDRWILSLPPHRAERPQWVTGWEVARLDSMFRNIVPGDVVYDIGTEEGDMSALFAFWAGMREGHGGIVLFEPNPRVWPNVRAIWQANGLPTPEMCFVGFAGDEDRHLQTMSDPWPACAFGPIIGDHGFANLSERPDIASIRIDTMAERCDPPSVITMDTEGSEWHVLNGATRILSEHRPLVYVSVHPQFSIDMYAKTRDDLLALMAGHGYRATHLETDHEEHWVFHHPDGHPFVL
jgi:FkbM family methyltransferase